MTSSTKPSVVSGAVPEPEAIAKPDLTIISRESLLDGSAMATMRKIMSAVAPEVKVYTDEEMLEAQEAMLKQRPNRTGTWVFGYGSLLWNPAFNYTERVHGTVQGWSRLLNLWMEGGRGSKENPGLMLGLEKGGSVQGVVMCLPPGEEDLELSLVWRREAATDAYTPQWVQVTTNQGQVVDAITFVSNTKHPWYAGVIEEEKIARLARKAEGTLGTNVEYIDNTVQSLQTLNIHDDHMERVQQLIRKIT
jgi:cation transport protein ChaC